MRTIRKRKTYRNKRIYSEDKLECLNKKCDPNFQQAMIEVEDNNMEPGMVVQEIQKGYMMKDRLLRPSLVGITNKRGENASKDEKKTEEKGKKQ